MTNGQIVLLNGVSSSGKTSIAKALQTMIEEPCLHLCIDDYLSAFQRSIWRRPEILTPQWPHMLRGFYAAGAAIARAGNLVIIDSVLEADPPWVESLLEIFCDVEVIFVGVRCPLEELERRERARTDHRPGVARLQFDQVHAQAEYDLEVDTSAFTPQECASQILAWMKAGYRPAALERLKKHRGSGGNNERSRTMGGGPARGALAGGAARG